FEYAIRRRLPLAREMDVHSDAGVLRVLHELERHRVVLRYDGGLEPVFAIGAEQHLGAAFYRNTVIHFFLHAALAQAAPARAGAPGVEDPVAVFWNTVLAGRDLLKFEFFFEPRHVFRAALAAELAREAPDWELQLTKGCDAIQALLQELRPLIAHTVLRSFLEAYAVVAAALVHHEAAEIDEREFLNRCLALGRQYQLPQRIHSPESLAKPLFSNALQLAKTRGLVGPTADARGRRRFLDEVRAAIRDLDAVESVATVRIVSLINAEPAAPISAPALAAGRAS